MSRELDVWLTVREAARLAGVDDDTIRRWTDKGRLVHRRTPGGHRRIAEADLVALLEPPDGAGARAATPAGTPDVAVEVWAEAAADWFDWSPPSHVSDDRLVEMRAAIQGYSGTGGLIGALTALVDVIDDELAERDHRSATRAPARTRPGPSSRRTVTGERAPEVAPGDGPLRSPPPSLVPALDGSDETWRRARDGTGAEGDVDDDADLDLVGDPLGTRTLDERLRQLGLPTTTERRTGS